MTVPTTYPLLMRSKTARLWTVLAVLAVPLAVIVWLTWPVMWIAYAVVGVIVGGIAGVLGAILIGGTTIFWVSKWVKTGSWYAWYRFLPWNDQGE